MVSIKRKMSGSINRQKAVEMASIGHSQSQIARSLGVTAPAVSKMLKVATKHFIQATNELLETEKLRQSHALQYALNEARECWEESRIAGTPDKDYLQQFVDILAELRKVWGLDIKRTEHSGSAMVNVNNSNYDIRLANLPLDLVERILDHQTDAPMPIGDNIMEGETGKEDRENSSRQYSAPALPHIPEIENKKREPRDGAIEEEEGKGPTNFRIGSHLMESGGDGQQQIHPVPCKTPGDPTLLHSDKENFNAEVKEDHVQDSRGDDSLPGDSRGEVPSGQPASQAWIHDLLQGDGEGAVLEESEQRDFDSEHGIEDA